MLSDTIICSGCMKRRVGGERNVPLPAVVSLPRWTRLEGQPAECEDCGGLTEVRWNAEDLAASL